MLGIERQIDGGHTALAEDPLDAVRPGEGFADPRYLTDFGGPGAGRNTRVGGGGGAAPLTKKGVVRQRRLTRRACSVRA